MEQIVLRTTRKDQYFGNLYVTCYLFEVPYNEVKKFPDMKSDLAIVSDTANITGSEAALPFGCFQETDPAKTSNVIVSFEPPVYSLNMNFFIYSHAEKSRSELSFEYESKSKVMPYLINVKKEDVSEANAPLFNFVVGKGNKHEFDFGIFYTGHAKLYFSHVDSLLYSSCARISIEKHGAVYILPIELKQLVF